MVGFATVAPPLPSPPDIEARIERARALIAPWEGRPGVLGAFLCGSSVRPYADAASDYDVRVVVEDEAFAHIPAVEVHTSVSEGGKKVQDIWNMSRGELERPVRELERHRARFARVLFDRAGELGALLASVAQMPTATREARLRVHYYEVTYLAQKVQNAQRRTQRSVALLLCGHLVLATAKLLLVERGEWTPPLSWVFEEMAIAGVPADTVAILRALLENPEPRAIRGLRGTIDSYLLERGTTFIKDPLALWEWLYDTPEGQLARSEWGGEGLRLS